MADKGKIDFSNGLKKTSGYDPIGFSKDDKGCTCHRCGSVYKLDLMVNDHLWLRLTGNADKGLWCASCIVKAIEELEGFSAYKLLKL